ncbi:LAQU0S28e00474g1_1 [Lachancea quebecensis]|uniref:Anaphase-promoting complex subunit 2 n=1 Tax=Lachancea quebecensis TaxID=1654605 RepID=A0A0P1L596_9SACH|nr:LAQU0S28e00474g1_1 [Lachancea quebecensis]
MISPDEGDELGEQLHKLLHEIDTSLEDDLEGVLTWVNPNEPNSNHQMRPPSLRVKSTIKTLLSSAVATEPFIDILGKYMIFQTRKHFFLNYRSLSYFKDVQKIERYYEFPTRYVNLFSNGEWCDEMNGLRNYLIRQNLELKNNIQLRLEQLVHEDDFDMACKIYEWLCQAEGRLLPGILVDVLISKVKLFASKNMNNAWTQRFTIMEAYNLFVTKYWSTFSRMLQCMEDDHEVTNEIYRCFEEEFIRIRTSQVFDIFVTEFPTTRPTLLELRSVLKTSAKYTELIREFLYQFESRMLNPSITTAEILLSYVKAIKSILIVDVSFRYFQLLTNFVRPYLMERRDTVVTFLYAMLGLDASDLSSTNSTSTHMSIASQLSAELKDSHRSISSSAIERGSQPYSKHALSMNPNEPAYQQIIDFYLHWNPEPADSIQANNDQSLISKELFDIIVELFDSKDVIVREFLGLFTRKLLDLKGYKLELNWVQSLKVLKKKLDFKTYSNAQEISNINNIDVMLRDVKHSEDLCSQMHEELGLSDRVIPKFISYLFWNVHSDFSALPKDHPLPKELETDINNYKQAYTHVKKGRKLRLHPEHSIVELQLRLADGRNLNYEVTLDKALVLSCLSDNGEKTLEDVVKQTNFEAGQVERSLKYWVKSAIVRYNTETSRYSIEEKQNLTEKHNVEGQSSSDNVNAIDSGAGLQQQQFLDSLQKVLPFIKGMLTNLGSLKVDKIHSFLKMAVPKEIGYSATPSQLQLYLSTLADENKLVKTPNGAFRLAK